MTSTPGNSAAVAITRSRLAFLHGDLCLTEEAVAAIFGVARKEVADARERFSVKWCHHVFGQLSRTCFLSLAGLLGVASADIDAVVEGGRWHVMKAVLSREFQRLAKERAIPWKRVDAFLASLPAVQAAAQARVTPAVLEFLYGDLGARIAEVMTILGASEETVRQGLAVHGVERHHEYHPELDERALDELARRLGAEEWPKDWSARSRWDRHWPTVEREVREGMLGLARKGELDCVVLEKFIESIPAIVAEEREKWFARFARAKPTADQSNSTPAEGT